MISIKELYNSITIEVIEKQNKEIINKNILYSLTKEDILKELETYKFQPQHINDAIERIHFIEKLDNIYKLFVDDINTRRAIIRLNYFDNDEVASCISLMHFIIRNNILYFNIYVRSQNIKNFEYDIYTFFLLTEKMMFNLSKIVPIYKTEMNITIGSLHLI